MTRTGTGKCLEVVIDPKQSLDACGGVRAGHALERYVREHLNEIGDAKLDTA